MTRQLNETGMEKENKLGCGDKFLKINPIEDAIQKGDIELDLYLSEVGKEQFVADVADLKRRYANKQAIQGAIDHLSTLL